MRWRTFTTVIPFLLLVILQQVSSNAMFELQLNNFHNHNGYNSEGHCCSGYRDTYGRCSEKCLTKFRVCLKVYQEVIDYHNPCTFGEITTPILGENEIDFAKVHKDGFLNPVQITLDAWQDTFSLIIEAWHDNNSTSSYAGPVLVQRLMTQRSLDVNPVWSVDEESTDHSTLSYQYRVVCSENYYGKGCRKWCKPRDDPFGHYVCDADGNVQCLDGWESPHEYCLTPICKTGCKGSCLQPNECICHMGYEGENCDKCKIYPGCDHGSCQEPWQCNCEEGWGGLFCNQDLNFCTNHKPCKNGATCLNTSPGSYSCECPPGFSGTNCEVTNHTCATDPCLNGGTCLDTGNDGFVCQCPTGFTGQYCHISGKTCADRPCLNNGACLDTKSGFQCRCPAGFEGETCQIAVNECDSNPCANGGSCVDEHAGFTCVCNPGFTGKQCETNINDCAHTPCLNNGRCLDGINSFKCECPAGYFGPLCEIVEDVCLSAPCANGGICSPTSDGFTKFVCRCQAGWGGRLCNEVKDYSSPCESAPCQNGGLCTEAPELSNGYRCTCPHGLIGPQCTVPILSHPLNVPQARVDMSSGQIVLIVIFSVAVPVLVLVFVLVIVCMKRRRRLERLRQDEEARKQNEQNLIHTAVNNKCLEHNMIFNSLDYPVKPINTDSQYKQIAGIHYPKSYMSGDSKSQQLSYDDCSKKAIENAYSIAPARSTKTLNTDSSRLSLASRLEKDLDSTCGRRAYDDCSNNTYCKTPDHTSSANYTPAPLSSSSGSRSTCSMMGPDQPSRPHPQTQSNNTLNSTCSPSTCTTPSSVYVIEEHYDDDYFATEV